MSRKKNKFSLEYRWDGRWMPLMKFPTKKEAQEYAKTSHCCQSNGYQIRKIK